MADYGTMPTTFTGLLLFLVLLVPGFIYVAKLRRNRPSQRLSVFQESASVAMGSAAAMTLALAVFAAIRAWVPDITPDVGRWIRDGNEYAKQEYALIIWWGIGVMVLAIMIAVAAGSAAARWLPVHPSSMSSWWTLFDRWPAGSDVTVDCVIDDGSWVQGVLASYNDSADDIADRDLILRPPIVYGPPGTTDQYPHSTSGVSISARRIVMMSVTYTKPSEITANRGGIRKWLRERRRSKATSPPSSAETPGEEAPNLGLEAAES